MGKKKTKSYFDIYAADETDCSNERPGAKISKLSMSIWYT